MRFIKIISIFVLLNSAFGQDIITKKDGTDIHAKILEVTPNEVKFKKTSNPDGPVFTMLKSDILIVRYANGENEVFDVKEEKPINLNTTFAVVPGMMYNDYKDFYDTHEYVRQPGDPYNPFWIGFGDFFIPCDAVHISKVKNMYNQDLRAQRASLDFNVEPYFAYTPYAPGAVKPVAGLSFKVNF